MSRYLVELKQSFFTPITVYADNIEDAQKRAVYGLGDFGDQEAGELKIVATRLLDQADEANHG
ncbi:hypothetical protein [Zhongshania sp.]|uniref:hypothetical protein n=1 Tax=Zhongshania sp. TaxID=1971902 RepID=UPI0035665399